MNLTPYQIAEAFPKESREYIPKVLMVLRSKLLDYREQIKTIESLPIEDDKKELCLSFINHNMPKSIKRRIEDYEKVMELLKNKPDGDFDKNILKAKNVKIETLFEPINPRRTANRLHCCCPLHQEKNPSFIIYLNSNTYYCFSCNAGGDVINFFMNFNKCNFKKAIESLTK